MDDRKLNILYAVIESYTLNAEPVGSRTISKVYDFGVSSATIRNEMSDLEGLGYLAKPHSSAGRVPSDKAYRMYVDYLMMKMLEDLGEFPKILGDIDEDDDEDNAVKNLAQKLAQLTDYPALAIVSKLPEVSFTKVHLTELDSLNLLLILVYDTGHVSHHRIPTLRKISSEEIDHLSRVLNKEYSNKPIQDILDGRIGIKTKDEAIKDVVLEVLSVFKSISNELNEVQVIYDGISNIFNHPEYEDMEEAKNFVDILENKDLVFELFSGNEGEGLTVSIGEEITSEGLENHSIVSTLFGPIYGKVGRVGIIGPKRMDYNKVISKFLMLSEAVKKNK